MHRSWSGCESCRGERGAHMVLVHSPLSGEWFGDTVKGKIWLQKRWVGGSLVALGMGFASWMGRGRSGSRYHFRVKRTVF